MQDKRLIMRLISIPADMLYEAGITDYSVVEMFVADGNVVIRKAEDMEDFVCDFDCENCPFNYTECDDNCRDCPCREHCEDCI